MSMRERIGPHLPYLRRYARALTGSAQSGDAFVRATLEALVSGQVSIDENVPIRVALYKVFHIIWAGPGAKYDPKQDGALASGASPEERLKGLSVLTRQALLLSAVEGFAFSDVGAILGVSKDDAQKLATLELEGNLVVRDIARLERVDRALRKIEEGTYGASDQSGQLIARERLEAIPESIYTLAEEQAREQAH